ncbi:PREDICTED: carbonic anhydrase 2-like [Priapulus caudatus]|uniref:Carbonic anhydrase n=1 Tax=Priapulus caudatus TaxID=37621 RepID=A0ABM1EMV7_PRICU|nr:PREDICTED: carbonic anhydrase 2-like [Priapulus caudatus]
MTGHRRAMGPTLSILVAIIGATLCGAPTHAAKKHWGYHETNLWSTGYPDCKGENQSPIDIKGEEYNPKLGEFKFNGYFKTQTMEFHLTNNGHTAVATLDPRPSLSTQAGGLPGVYIPHSLHFHWGGDRRTGSEHFINGKQYPLEMHLVHYHSSYPNISMAQNQPHGLAVLGVLFEVSETKNKVAEVLFSALSAIKNQHDVTTIKSFDVLSMLPADRPYFYRYQGSLTTPPCYESVVWTVFASPNYISASQMDKLRALMHEGEHGATNLINNYRPLQDIGTRKIYKSFKKLPEKMSLKGAADHVTVMWAVAAAMTVIAFAGAKH